MSDRGSHFTAHALARLAREAEVVPVLSARHRPQAKAPAIVPKRPASPSGSGAPSRRGWPAQAWDGSTDLAPLLCRFHQEYNARPHHGLGIPGVSPDECARRLWLR